MSFFVNFSNCIIIAENFNKEESHQQRSNKDEAEDVECEEVKVEPQKTETPAPTTAKDYSKSPLVRYMTHPEQAQPLLEWLHSNMDNQKTDRERIKPLKAVFEKKYFKSTIPYEDYKKEFGDEVDQTQYSRLMGKGGKYSEDELKLVLKSLNL